MGRLYSLGAMTSIGQVVRRARVAKGWSQADLAKAVGIRQPSVAAIEKGDKARKSKYLPDIARALDFELPDTDGGIAKHTFSKAKLGLKSDNVPIPEYDVRVSAGGGFVIAEETQKDVWVFSRRYLADEMRLPLRQLVVLEVIGDSMEPTLHSGDRVLVNMGDKRVSQPGIFVLWDGDGTVVKRLEIIPGSDPLRIVRISDNPLHRTHEVLADDTNIIGRVVWVARRM